MFTVTRASKAHWKTNDAHRLIDRVLADGFTQLDTTRPTELAKLWKSSGNIVSVQASGYVTAQGALALELLYSLECEVQR